MAREARRFPESLTIAEQVLDPAGSTVLDLIDELLNQGVMATGDVTLGVAGIDLVYLRLSALLGAFDRVHASGRRSAAGRRRRARGRGLKPSKWQDEPGPGEPRPRGPAVGRGQPRRVSRGRVVGRACQLRANGRRLRPLPSRQRNFARCGGRSVGV